MSVLKENHTPIGEVMSYFTQPFLYFLKEEINDYNFITDTIKGKNYIIPIHKTKSKESNFEEHIYYHLKKELRPFKVRINNQNRFYCINCGKLAKILKKEYRRPLNSDECKSCYLDFLKNIGMRKHAYHIWLENDMKNYY
jgi:hypothetical protein